MRSAVADRRFGHACQVELERRTELGSLIARKRILETAAWMDSARHQARRRVLTSEEQMAHFMGDHLTEDGGRIYSKPPREFRRSIVQNVGTNAWLDDSTQNVRGAECAVFKRGRRRYNDCRPPVACLGRLAPLKTDVSGFEQCRGDAQRAGHLRARELCAFVNDDTWRFFATRRARQEAQRGN